MNKYWREIWNNDVRDGSLAAYTFALFCVVLATAIRVGVDALEEPSGLPFATYFPAVLFASLFAGYRAGILAIALSLFVGWLLFMPSSTIPEFGPSYIFLRLILVALALGIIVWGAGRYRFLFHKNQNFMRQLQNERKHREIVVGELRHRLKNKLATVYAILNRELNDNPEIWDKISGRLNALSAADDFIAKADGRGASLNDILKTELFPYQSERIILSTQEIFLPPKLASTLALIFHELTTNAVKYGALSNADGRISVHWQSRDDKVEIEWSETRGPVVIKPERHGFGMTLIERSLPPYRGKARTFFNPGGFVCRLSFSTDEPSFGDDDAIREDAKNDLSVNGQTETA